MAALLKIHFAPTVRRSAVKHWEFPAARDFGELARRVGGTLAEILVFLWTSLALAFFGLVAAGFLIG